MPTGLQISQTFIDTALLPMLRRELGRDLDRLAVAIVGTGSDVQGLDDQISRDHHWGPRANVMYRRAEADTLGRRVQQALREHTPGEWDGFQVHLDIANLTGVCSCAVEDFFRFFLGTDRLPATDLDWLTLCEVDLLHVTSGMVVFDGAGELTRRREALAYYPDHVWKKRLADWCMYVTGRDAPYNLHRVSKRHEAVASAIYLGQCLRRQLELLFAVNRRYAPYSKWLFRQARSLPRAAPKALPMLEAVTTESDPRKRVLTLVEVNFVIAEELADLGLTSPPRRRPFDEGLTDLTLYDSAVQIYQTLPTELLDPSFNQIELWERMARQVLLDPKDYFQSQYEKRP